MRSNNLILEPTKHHPSQHSGPMNDGDIIGFDNEARKIIRFLIRGTNQLDVIPIVGMGGQGKTAISTKVYNCEKIVSHFDVRAWCCVSQAYNRIELLREIYRQVPNSKLDEKDDDDELADTLRKSLMGRRYLIVLDDMWDVKAWEDLRLSFPVGENGNRIIVTTRLEEVGMQVKHYTDLYFLSFLPLQESCELLQKRVFQKEDFPLELEDVCLAVAKRCKGLPLVVVLIAGIIKKEKWKESWWHEVKDALFSYLGESEEYSLATMQLSYDHLPGHIRPCLLYMGMFPEDARIPVSKLISLWIAEGFMQNVESERLEEAAEGYLMDLISRNVVMVSSRRYNGKVKYCQVHDIVHHFCLARSREEKFMLAVNGHCQPLDWKGTRMRFDVHNKLSKFDFLGSKTQDPFNQPLRSLMTASESNRLDWNPFPQVSKLRLLKVLDLSSLCVSGILSSVTFHPLIHLKYLAIHTVEFDFHPESCLCNLETLIVRKSSVSDIVLRAILWKMEKLRHVDISRAIFRLEENKQWIFDRESSALENMRMLRNVAFRIEDVDCMAVLLQRCPNLQELAITIYGSELSFSGLTNLNLEIFTHLQQLRLSVCASRIIVSELHLPSNLKMLTLKGPNVATMTSLIAGLPSLEYLELKDSGYESEEEWCLGDITFCKLKFLKLVRLGISRWDASEESFPVLETLVIKWCYKLQKIPLSFADIPTLKQIKMIWQERNSSLEASAVEIKEEVEALEGCDRIDLTIERR